MFGVYFRGMLSADGWKQLADRGKEQRMAIGIALPPLSIELNYSSDYRKASAELNQVSRPKVRSHACGQSLTNKVRIAHSSLPSK